MIRNLQFREFGKSNKIKNLIENKRISQLNISKHHDFASFHSSSVNCCDLDPVEVRYLLSGGEDGSIGIHDLHYNNTFESTQFKLISSTNHRESRHSSVSSVQWYPRDTGLFLSSGSDRLLKIWDTNAMSLATEFKFPAAISSHKMSPSNLIVAVCNREQVQIVDLQSGSYIQKLNGSHNDDVIDVCWSPRNERQIISAGKDGQLVMWDTRRLRSCCFKFKRKHPVRDGAGKSAITSLSCLPDCMHLLTFSRRGTLTMWDLLGGVDVSRNPFPEITNSSPGKLPIATSDFHAFVPSRNHIHVVDLFSGKASTILKGHLEDVTCVLHQAPMQHLITSSRDHSLLYWSADQVPERLDEGTNLTQEELNEREANFSAGPGASGGGSGVGGFDYFSYSAEEYYKVGGVDGGRGDGGDSHLVQDNWSDDD